MRELSYKEALHEALQEAMRADARVFIMGEDIGIYGGAYGVEAGLQAEFGVERVRETPISETAFVGAAIGAAMMGMRPVVQIMFADFTAVCFDQIINQAAKAHFLFGGQASVPLVIRCPVCGESGMGAQHSQSQEALFCHISGLKVVAPSCAYDAKGLLLSAIQDDNPVLFFESKQLYTACEEVPAGSYAIPLGKAEVKRRGEDLSLITYGRATPLCLAAADSLQDRLSVEVLDLRTLSPLDSESILQSVGHTGRAVIVHEAARFCGLGAELAAQIAESGIPLKAPIHRICGLDCPIPCTQEMEALVYPNVEKIRSAILESVR